MTLVALQRVSKSYGARLVLDGLELDVGDGARIGVIGPNGCGKSTMLRLIAGREEPDAGEVVRRRGLVVAFLPQQVAGDERTALETVRAARPALAALDEALPAGVDRLGGEGGARGRGRSG